MDSRPLSPLPTVFPEVSEQARANFYGLTRDLSTASSDDEKSTLVVDNDGVDHVRGPPGTQRDEVYAAAMAGWRYALRTAVMTNLAWESELLARMQERVRTPWLDNYFVSTSTLGTHTFFLIFLPAFFYFGFPEQGMGMVFQLCMGVYFSSFIKDLVCAPRPFAPPVTRLTIGTHHLEYGFPSAHSANAVSMALYCYSMLAAAHVSDTTYYVGVAMLSFYAFSIVYGRLYTGMHSITDCIVGSALGAGIWWFHQTFGKLLDDWITSNGIEVPIILTALAVLMINQHPQPADDCPCFEDAIAFIAVLAGILVSRWYTFQAGFHGDFYQTRTPGWQHESYEQLGLWVALSMVKLVGGVVVLAVWRIVAKFLLHAILPPIFRALARITSLPNRRFYIPATDYTNVPSDKTLQPIPSVIDLPSTLHAHAVGGRRQLPRPHLKQRKGKGSSSGVSTPQLRDAEEFTTVDDDEPVKHYDADVMTKAVVYAGIGIIASQVTPIAFELTGVGLN